MLSRVSIFRFSNVFIITAIMGFIYSCGETRGEMSVRDIDPKVGHTQGEQPVRIIGDNFRQDIGYAVYFGARKAGNVTILNPNTILVSTPGGMDLGPVDVLIRSDDGKTFRLPKAFEFKEMGGSVVGGLGESVEAKKEEKGNLAF